MFRASSCPSSGATTTAVAASGLPSELDDSSAIGRGRADWPDHDQRHCYHHAPTVNQRLLLQLLQLLMMGMRMPETYWAVFKWQVINLKRCCIWLVDSVESKKLSVCDFSLLYEHHCDWRHSRYYADWPEDISVAFRTPTTSPRYRIIRWGTISFN